MIDSVFSYAGLADVHGDLFRNIVSLRESEDLFDDLSDDPEQWQSAVQLEIETKSPMFESPRPIIDRPFEETTWNAAIGYPFAHWMRSRYSDGTFGVWYGADGIETTVFETLYHWCSGLLGDAGFLEPGTRIERKVYRVGCDAALVDLRPAVSACPGLVDRKDYTLTQLVGARLHREGHPGLVSRSARCAGDIHAVLNPQVLSQPRPSCYLTYTLTSTGIDVEREPGVVWMTVGTEDLV